MEKKLGGKFIFDLMALLGCVLCINTPGVSYYRMDDTPHTGCAIVNTDVKKRNHHVCVI